MNKTIISILAVLVVVAGGWYILSRGPKADPKAAEVDPNQVVATVNGENITRGQLNTALAQGGATTTEARAQYQSQALDALVNQTLLRQEVAKAGVTASSTEVESQINQAKSQFSSADAYNQALQAQGLTEAGLRAQIENNLALNAYLSQKLNLNSITATDAEIKAAYDQAAAGQTNAPALTEVRDTVRQYVIGQKQQTLINAYIEELKKSADIKINI